MNRYDAFIAEINDRITILRGRVIRFEAKGLHSRIPGVRQEIAELEAKLPSVCATARWAKELGWVA